MLGGGRAETDPGPCAYKGHHSGGGAESRGGTRRAVRGHTPHGERNGQPRCCRVSERALQGPKVLLPSGAHFRSPEHPCNHRVRHCPVLVLTLCSRRMQPNGAVSLVQQRVSSSYVCRCLCRVMWFL